MVLTIAMDGPVGAGKSSVADEVARRLGIPHLDTGAMYRAFAWQALKEGIDTNNAQALAAYDAGGPFRKWHATHAHWRDGCDGLHPYAGNQHSRKRGFHRAAGAPGHGRPPAGAGAASKHAA